MSSFEAKHKDTAPANNILGNFKYKRLFGKEITNVLEPHQPPFPRKDAARLSLYSRKDRGISEDVPKNANTNATCGSIIPNGNSTTRQAGSLCRENIRKEQLSCRSFSSSHREEGRELTDVQHVPEYFESNIRFMQQQEVKTNPTYNCMSQQKDLNQGMRSVLLDWLVDVHLRYKMFPQTLFLTVSIIDRYLTKRQVLRSKLQLVGASAFFMAAKYEETYEVPELSDMIALCARAFSREEFLEMESQILQTLDFDLIVDSSYRFYEAFCQIAGVEGKYFSLGRYMLELGLFDLKTQKHKPSLQAASTIYFLNKVCRKSQSAWPDYMIAATGYEESEVKSCAKELCPLLENSVNNTYVKNLKRKFTMPTYHEVAKLRLEVQNPNNNGSNTSLPTGN